MASRVAALSVGVEDEEEDPLLEEPFLVEPLLVVGCVPLAGAVPVVPDPSSVGPEVAWPPASSELSTELADAVAAPAPEPPDEEVSPPRSSVAVSEACAD